MGGKKGKKRTAKDDEELDLEDMLFGDVDEPESAAPSAENIEQLVDSEVDDNDDHNEDKSDSDDAAASGNEEVEL